MASCYGRISAPSVGIGKFFERLPIKTSLPDGTKVEVDVFRERYWDTDVLLVFRTVTFKGRFVLLYYGVAATKLVG